MPAKRDHGMTAVEGVKRLRGTAEVRTVFLAESADSGLGFSGAADVAHPLLGLIKVRHGEIVRF